MTIPSKQTMPSGCDERGLTLIELLIALAMIGVITAAVFASVRAMAGAWAVGQHRVGIQQHGRAAIEWMTRRLRIAGQGWDVAQGPIYTFAGRDRVRFLADFGTGLRQYEYAIDGGRLVERKYGTTGRIAGSLLAARPLTPIEEVGIITAAQLNFCYFDIFGALLNGPRIGDPQRPDYGACTGPGVAGTALGSIYRIQVRLTLESGRRGESPLTLVAQAMSRSVKAR
jgi:prepilin-type N-terminal cleavage/methylation domain-containing protein